MKLRHLLPLITMALLVTACDSNPGWIGASPKGKTEELASETCKCLYELAGTYPGWDRAAILEEIENIRKTDKSDLPAAIEASDNAALSKAFNDEYDFSMKVDECDCMKPVLDGQLERGVDFDEMMDVIDTRCLLGAFYN